MPGYVEKALKTFQHSEVTRPEHQPHRNHDKQYGVRTQLTEPLDTTAPLDATGNLKLQQLTGTFLYYARAMDPTMLVALSTLASQQTRATKQTATDAVKFLNYCATHPDACIKYHASDMVLTCHSDASYLTEPKARSRAAGFFNFGNKPTSPPNGAVLVTTTIMKPVLALAAEVEIGALFKNCKKVTILRQTLEEMGWPQPATPMQTDNSTASGIANDTIRQQRSRAMDMRFYWVRDRRCQGHFHIYWGPGGNNLADYFSKQHPARHHQLMRPIYLHDRNQQQANAVIAYALHVLQGCVKPAPMTGQTRTNAESQKHHNASRHHVTMGIVMDCKRQY